VKKFYKNTSLSLRDGRKRFLFSNNEICFLSFKLLLESNFSKMKLKKHLFSMNRQILNHSLTSVNNRCLITGKGKSIYKEFRLSRIIFRKAADSGLLAGVKRSYW
jgi:succinate dehydrogenase (ubiquinone) iron-sulfur subunit